MPSPDFEIDLLVPGHPEDVWARLWDLDRHTAAVPLTTVHGGSLGPDATPVIAERLPDDLAACVLANLRHDTDPDPLWGWNLGRARAAEAVPAGSDAQSPPEEGGQGCLRVIGEDGR